jgi:hypothetical protein
MYFSASQLGNRQATFCSKKPLLTAGIDYILDRADNVFFILVYKIILQFACI